MGSIDFLNCSEKERWEHLARLDEALINYNLAKKQYIAMQRERKRIKARLCYYDKYRHSNDEAAGRYEILSVEYDKLFDKEQEYYVKMLSVDLNKLREQYSGLIEVKYWKLIGYMLLDYYSGQETEVKQALDKYVKKMRIKSEKRS